MTIICYRNGVLCSDSLITSEGTIIGYSKKIFKSPDGWIAGGAGGATLTKRLESFMSTNVQNMERCWDTNVCKDGDQVIMISPDGVMYGGTENGYYEIHWPYQAEGSAYKVAMGAMEYGASAKEAVSIAIKLEPGMCGGEIQELHL